MATKRGNIQKGENEDYKNHVIDITNDYLNKTLEDKEIVKMFKI